jgi:hypothetical protein
MILVPFPRLVLQTLGPVVEICEGRFDTRATAPAGQTKGTGAEHPRNAIEHGARSLPGTSSTVLSTKRLGNKDMESCPLVVGQVS